MKPIELALQKKPGEKYTVLESIIMAWNVKHPADAEEAVAELIALREENAYLTYFHQNADFGPAHGDIVCNIQERYKETSGKDVPVEWKYE